MISLQELFHSRKGHVPLSAYSNLDPASSMAPFFIGMIMMDKTSPDKVIQQLAALKNLARWQEFPFQIRLFAVAKYFQILELVEGAKYNELLEDIGQSMIDFAAFVDEMDFQSDENVTSILSSLNRAIDKLNSTHREHKLALYAGLVGLRFKAKMTNQLPIYELTEQDLQSLINPWMQSEIAILRILTRACGVLKSTDSLSQTDTLRIAVCNGLLGVMERITDTQLIEKVLQDIEENLLRYNSLLIDSHKPGILSEYSRICNRAGQAPPTAIIEALAVSDWDIIGKNTENRPFKALQRFKEIHNAFLDRLANKEFVDVEEVLEKLTAFEEKHTNKQVFKTFMDLVESETDQPSAETLSIWKLYSRSFKIGDLMQPIQRHTINKRIDELIKLSTDTPPSPQKNSKDYKKDNIQDPGEFAPDTERMEEVTGHLKNVWFEAGLSKGDRSVVKEQIQEVMGYINEYIQESIHVFGSFATKLSLRTSNIDITVVTQDVTKNVFIQGLSEIFATKPGNMNAKTEGDYPLIRFSNQNGLEFCITVNNQCSVKSTELMKTYFSMNPVARDLCVCIKAWAKSKNLMSRRYYTSYTWTILTVAFLQQLEAPVFPCLQSGEHEPEILDECDVWFNKSLEFATENKADLGTLVTQFFYFFAFRLPEIRSAEVNIRTGTIGPGLKNMSLLMKIYDPFEDIELGTILKDSKSSKFLLKALREAFGLLYETGNLALLLN